MVKVGTRVIAGSLRILLSKLFGRQQLNFVNQILTAAPLGVPLGCSLSTSKSSSLTLELWIKFKTKKKNFTDPTVGKFTTFMPLLQTLERDFFYFSFHLDLLLNKFWHDFKWSSYFFYYIMSPLTPWALTWDSRLDVVVNSYLQSPLDGVISQHFLLKRILVNMRVICQQCWSQL